MFKNNYTRHCLGFFVLLCFFFVKYSNAESTTLDAWDNLDSSFVVLSLLPKVGLNYFFPEYIVNNIFDGVKVSVLYPRISFGDLWFFFFTPEKAYIINEIVTRVVAFLGLNLLGNKIFEELKLRKYSTILILLVSLCFSFLPFNPTPYLSIAIQPLIIFCLINFYNNQQKIYDWIICITCPFYTSIFIGAEVIILYFIFFNFFYFYKNKIINKNLFLINFLVIILYLLSIYKGIYLLLFDNSFLGIKSIIYKVDVSIIDEIKILFSEALGNFIYGDGHAPSMHTFFIFSSILLALFIEKSKNNKKTILQKLVLFNFFISLIYGFLEINNIQYYIKEIFPLLSNINLTRINHIQALIWYLSFLYSLIILFESKDKFFLTKLSINQIIILNLILFFSCILFLYQIYPTLINRYADQYPDDLSNIFRLTIILLIFFFIFITFLFLGKTSNLLKKYFFFLSKIQIKYLFIFILVFGQSIYNLNIFKINKALVINYEKNWHHAGIENTSFEKYFLKNIFREIKEKIDIENINFFKVGSIGLSPSIPLYHGFNVIDMYLPNYQLDYNRNFYQIIKEEIKNIRELNEYFLNVGKRCYLYSSSFKVHPNYFKKYTPNLINLNFNFQLMKKKGVKYLFSITTINTKNSLEFVGKFENKKYPYLNDIYVYEIK